uniref:Uncharacterized protein n=1 Tax=Romanomermis culicivorax TaxID=13658 RepID=A0A915JTH3_ROMCU
MHLNYNSGKHDLLEIRPSVPLTYDGSVYISQFGEDSDLSTVLGAARVYAYSGSWYKTGRIISTVFRPSNSRFSKSINCLKNPTFGRMTDRLDPESFSSFSSSTSSIERFFFKQECVTPAMTPRKNIPMMIKEQVSK